MFARVDNLNSHNFTNVTGRNDELGHFYMRYSDTGGRSWSESRYLVPYRSTWVDRFNTFHGRVRIMWTVDQIKVRNGVAYFAFTKIGRYVQNPPEEVFILSSPNLLSERNASKVEWRLLPDGDHGIAAPAIWNPNTTVMEEGHVLPLQRSAGFYAMARTQRGYLAAAKTASPDGASGWGPTAWARYWDNSRSHLPAAPAAGAAAPPSSQLRPLGDVRDPKNDRIFRGGLKSPRGPFTPKALLHYQLPSTRRPHGRTTADEDEDGAAVTGRYLLIYYNNHGAARNPYWLSVGMETDLGEILWSQPELAVYDRATHAGTSAGGYPDFVQEANGAVHITACQKGLPSNSTARMMTVEPTLLAGLLEQHTASGLPRLAPGVAAVNLSHRVALPALPQTANISTAKQGWSLMLVVRDHHHAKPGDLLLDTTTTTAVEGGPPGGGGGGTGSQQKVLGLLGENGTAGIQLSVPVPSAPKPLPPCPSRHCDGLPSTDMTDFYCKPVGAGRPDCCKSYRVDRGDKLAGSCAPNNQTLNATNGSPGLTFSFADPHGVLFKAQLDPACAAMLSGGGGADLDAEQGGSPSTHFIGIVVDAGPELVSWVVDGVLCDGGGVVAAGYSWVPQGMGGLPASSARVAAPAGGMGSYGGEVLWGQLVVQALRTSELVAAYRATVLLGGEEAARRHVDA